MKVKVEVRVKARVLGVGARVCTLTSGSAVTICSATGVVLHSALAATLRGWGWGASVRVTVRMSVKVRMKVRLARRVSAATLRGRSPSARVIGRLSSPTTTYPPFTPPPARSTRRASPSHLRTMYGNSASAHGVGWASPGDSASGSAWSEGAGRSSGGWCDSAGGSTAAWSIVSSTNGTSAPDRFTSRARQSPTCATTSCDAVTMTAAAAEPAS